MTRRPPSLRRLAFLLTLPVLLVAGMGVWAVVSEQERTLAEWKPGAREQTKGVLVQLPFQLSPEVNYPGHPLIGLALVGLTQNLGAHVYLGSEPPPPAESWPAVVEIRSALLAGQIEKARSLLQKYRTTLFAEIYRITGRRDYSPGGLPVRLILFQLKLEAAEESQRPRLAEDLCKEAERNPCEISSRAILSALPLLPAEDREKWKTKAKELERLLKLIGDRVVQRRLSGERGLLWDLAGTEQKVFPERGEWLGDWLLRARNAQTLEVISYSAWCELMSALLKETGIRESAGLPVAVHIAWHGRSVTPLLPKDGFVLADEALGPWRVSVLTKDRHALNDEVNARRRTKALIFGGLAAASALAAWAVYRTFKKQAELARMQSEFVASVSHELRTPVAGIGALAERLESGKANAAQTAEYHRMIAREGRRLAALVDNVLDFSRIERGAKAYDLDHADLPRLIRETAALLRPVAEEKGLTLAEEIADVPEDRWPPVDSVALRQALVNLLDNAIKFTPSGGTVTVGFSESGHVGRSRQVCITVKDTGIGIPVAEQARIFEKFYRVDNGLRRETTGAGIGLSIVQHIAGAHGARMMLESEEGKGSVFQMVFSKCEN